MVTSISSSAVMASAYPFTVVTLSTMMASMTSVPSVVTSTVSMSSSVSVVSVEVATTVVPGAKFSFFIEFKFLLFNGFVSKLGLRLNFSRVGLNVLGFGLVVRLRESSGNFFHSVLKFSTVDSFANMGSQVLHSFDHFLKVFRFNSLGNFGLVFSRLPLLVV